MLNLHERISETAPLCEFSATRRTSAFSSLSFFQHNAIILTMDYSLSVSVKKGSRGRENATNFAAVCVLGIRFSVRTGNSLRVWQAFRGTTAIPGWNARAYIANIKVQTLTLRAIHLFQ